MLRQEPVAEVGAATADSQVGAAATGSRSCAELAACGAVQVGPLVVRPRVATAGDGGPAPAESDESAPSMGLTTVR